VFEIAITVLLGITGGVAVGTQASIAGEMSRRVGGAATSLIVHLGGTLLSAVLLAARGGEQISNWRKISWYMWGAGAFGVVLYLTLSRTIPRLGAATALVLILIGQLGVGMLIDHFGLFGLPTRHMDTTRVAATVLLITGGYLMVR